MTSNPVSYVVSEKANRTRRVHDGTVVVRSKVSRVGDSKLAFAHVGERNL